MPNSPSLDKSTQPTAGAMRAASGIMKHLEEFKPSAYFFAQIIDRETQADVAELREALSRLIERIDLVDSHTESVMQMKDYSHVVAEARAVLARHAGAKA